MAWQDDVVMAAPATMFSTNVNAWERVADAVQSRRAELGLSQDEASRVSGLGKKSWAEIELAKKTGVRKTNAVKIERTLRWKPGSFERLLFHGDTPEIDETEPPDATEMVYMRQQIKLLGKRLSEQEEFLQALFEMLKTIPKPPKARN